MTVLSPNLKVLFLPIIFFIGVVALLMYSISFGYGLITKKLTETNSSNSQIAVLEEKVVVLREIKDGVLEAADVSVTALPEKNATLSLLSQMKLLAEEKQIILAGVKLSNIGSAQNDITKMDIVATIESIDPQQIVGFFTSLSDISPVSTLGEITLDKSTSGTYITSFTSSTYWSSLPQFLPKLTEPINKFTPEELLTIDILKQKKTSQFAVLTPVDPSERPSPFN